ncbi:MAG TPA: HD domain-containing protein [Clostridia bacterium]|nr:HD domain-containing protein [Clostridia bacterium]
MITLADVKKDTGIRALIDAGNRHLEGLGYTDHGPRHVGYVSKTAGKVLEALGFEARLVELATIAGYVHDVGNSINRNNHGLSGAVLLFPLLLKLDMPMEDVVEIVTAVGNHEEQTGTVTSPIIAALVLADKSDAHRSRVRGLKPDPSDIHDRVNFAIVQNQLTVDAEKRVICHRIAMDTSSSVLEYLQIYMTRIAMCEGGRLSWLFL